MKTRILPVLAALPFLAACEVPETPDTAPTEAAPAAAAVPAARPAAVAAAAAASPAPVAAAAIPAPAPVSATPLDTLDPPPAAEAASAEAPAAPPTPVATPSGQLGTTVASLGAPTDPGLWLETPLVAAPTQGRVEYNGQTVAVELRPSGGEPGSGSQISLEAMRALGAPLTGLPELTVFGG